jgi:hypothetical protein
MCEDYPYIFPDEANCDNHNFIWVKEYNWAKRKWICFWCEE